MPPRPQPYAPLAAVLACALAACGGDRGREAETPIIVLDLAPDAAPRPALAAAELDAGAAREQGPTCTRALVAGAVSKSTSTCFVDTVFQSGEKGTLHFPCAGGAARAEFEKRGFEGVVEGDSVRLLAETEYPFSDNCLWRTSQHLTGKLSSGALTLAYTETAEGTACSPVCTATAEVTVSP